MEKKFLHIVTPDDVETQVLSWGSFQWLNEPRVTGTENMAVGIGRIAPGRATPGTTTPAREFIYFLEGTAEQTVETEDNGFEKAVMKPGDLGLHPGELLPLHHEHRRYGPRVPRLLPALRAGGRPARRGRDNPPEKQKVSP